MKNYKIENEKFIDNLTKRIWIENELKETWNRIKDDLNGDCFKTIEKYFELIMKLVTVVIIHKEDENKWFMKCGGEIEPIHFMEDFDLNPEYFVNEQASGMLEEYFHRSFFKIFPDLLEKIKKDDGE